MKLSRKLLGKSFVDKIFCMRYSMLADVLAEHSDFLTRGEYMASFQFLQGVATLRSLRFPLDALRKGPPFFVAAIGFLT
jgi:hypothetical protein